MQTKLDSKVAPARDYQDYAPATEIVQEDECETLLISLPGFKKDQLRVQLTPIPSLKISGERHIGDNKWSRFYKEFPVSANCDNNKISARFDDGILYIRQPKIITSLVQKNEEEQVNDAQNPQKTETKPPLPQTTKMNETKSNDKADDEDKVASKSQEKDAADVAEKYQEEEEQIKGGAGNDEKGKRKRVDELENGDFMTGRIKMAKKVGRTMSVAVIILSAIMLGIYVKNLITPAKNYEN